VSDFLLQVSITANPSSRRRLFERVEDTLLYGTRTPPDKQLKDIDRKFEEQYKAINAYINIYLGPDSKTKQLDWEEVAKEDEVAGSWIKQIKADVAVKVPEGLPFFDF